MSSLDRYSFRTAETFSLVSLLTRPELQTMKNTQVCRIRADVDLGDKKSQHCLTLIDGQIILQYFIALTMSSRADPAKGV